LFASTLPSGAQVISSPYDGFSRKPLRLLIALVSAADIIALASGVILNPPSPISHPMAPRFLLALGGRPELVLPIAAIGLSGLFLFARSGSAILPGLVGLGSLFLLNETHAALIEGPMRIFFAAGATLLGWLAGLGYARWLGYSRENTERAERLAEMGAVAGLCATYLGAAASKLLASGFSWADANSLRFIIFSQRGIPDRSPFDWYAWTVATHPSLAWTLSSLTLAIQCGALVYPFSRRSRFVCGTLLLLFHLNVWFLTPILFLEGMTLLAAFSYPWPRWIARIRRHSPNPSPTLDADVPSPERIRQATLKAAAILAFLVVLAVVLPIRSYSLQHHRRSSSASPASSASAAPPVVAQKAGAEVRAWLDNLNEGDYLGGFHVDAITGPTERVVEVRVSRGELQFNISVVKSGTWPFSPPKSAGSYDLFYGRVLPSPSALNAQDRDRVLEALADRLMRTANRPAPAGI
jgi:hypothetical protein